MSDWKCEVVLGGDNENPYLSSTEIPAVLHSGQWRGLTIAALDNPTFIATRVDKTVRTRSSFSGTMAQRVRDMHLFDPEVYEVHLSRTGEIIKLFYDQGTTLTKKTGFRLEDLDDMVEWVWELASAVNAYPDTYLITPEGEIYDTIGSVGLGAFLYLGAVAGGLDSKIVQSLKVEEVMSIAQLKIFNRIGLEAELRTVLRMTLTPVYLESVWDKVVSVLRSN